MLNSKAEYNRCHIPRLRLEDEEESKLREQQIQEEDRLVEDTLAREQEDWETQKRKDKERRGLGSKSFPGSKQRPGSRPKRAATVGGSDVPRKRQRSRKYNLLDEDWGAQDSTTRRRKEQDDKWGAAMEDHIPTKESSIEGSRETPATPPPPMVLAPPSRDSSPTDNA